MARAPPLLALLSLGCLGLAAAQGSTQTLPAFSTINSCVPFNVLVQPANDTSTYAVQVDADPAAAKAISARVAGGTLFLETGSFMSRGPIKVAIYLPAGNLTAVNNFGQLSSIYVAPGFNVSSFNLLTGLGAGRTYVFNMTANTTQVQASGTGDVVLTGSYGTVELQTSGITSVYVSGVQQAVNVDLSGISNAYIVAADQNVNITGRASGISTVQYTQGQCSVQSAFLFTSACQQNPAITLSQPSPTWTSGLVAVGGSSCAAAANLGLLGAASAAGFPLTFAPIQVPQQAAAVQMAQPTPQAAAPAPEVSPPPPPPVAATPPPSSPNPSVPPVMVPAVEITGLPSPYAVGGPTPGGAQFQSGSVNAGGGNANAVSQGTNSASASSIATPTGTQTSTANDNNSIGTFGTGTLGTGNPVFG